MVFCKHIFFDLGGEEAGWQLIQVFTEMVQFLLNKNEH